MKYDPIFKNFDDNSIVGQWLIGFALDLANLVGMADFPTPALEEISKWLQSLKETLDEFIQRRKNIEHGERN